MIDFQNDLSYNNSADRMSLNETDIMKWIDVTQPERPHSEL